MSGREGNAVVEAVGQTEEETLGYHVIANTLQVVGELSVPQRKNCRSAGLGLVYLSGLRRAGPGKL